MGAKLLRSGFAQIITTNHEAIRGMVHQGRKPFNRWPGVSGLEWKTAGQIVSQEWKRACLPCRKDCRGVDWWR